MREQDPVTRSRNSHNRACRARPNTVGSDGHAARRLFRQTAMHCTACAHTHSQTCHACSARSVRGTSASTIEPVWLGNFAHETTGTAGPLCSAAAAPAPFNEFSAAWHEACLHRAPCPPRFNPSCFIRLPCKLLSPTPYGTGDVHDDFAFMGACTKQRLCPKEGPLCPVHPRRRHFISSRNFKCLAARPPFWPCRGSRSRQSLRALP
jgi:hypothetical protein